MSGDEYTTEEREEIYTLARGLVTVTRAEESPTSDQRDEFSYGAPT